MSAKTKSIIVISARVLLGLIYFVFGLNFFFHFIPTPPSTMSPEAESFTTGLFKAGYFFPFLKGLEVIAGVLLLAGLFVPLTLVVLAPISINILLFHTLLVPNGAVMGIAILALNLYLAWAYRDSYKPLFHSKTSISL